MPRQTVGPTGLGEFVVTTEADGNQTVSAAHGVLVPIAVVAGNPMDLEAPGVLATIAARVGSRTASAE
jgi:hypothetical protein